VSRTQEDRLRQVLLAEAEDLIPAGDGLLRIQQRLADRHSLRSKLVPALAIAGVVAVAGVAAITVSLTDDGSLKQPLPRATAPGPNATACAGGLCPEPIASPSLSTTGVTTSASGIPLWPVTTDAQAADWERLSNTPRWEADPVQVTQHLMDDFLKLPGQAMPRRDTNEDVALVDVSAGGRTVSQVRLVRVGRDASGPWSVVSATSQVLAVTQPTDGDEVSSPINVAGTVNDVDQSVHLRLMSDRVLGEGFQPAGRDLPWTHSLAWTSKGWSVAALVANTFSGKGDLSAVSITAVRRAGSSTPGIPAAGTVFVAIDQEHVVSVDALTGMQLRQLSYPSPGVVDGSPDRGGEDGVVWVRIQADNCTSSIVRAGLVRGPAGITVEAKPIGRSLPSLSAGGRSLGWVEQPCGGGDKTIVVRGPDAKFTTTAVSQEGINDLDVRDDGYAVVQLGFRVLVLAPGTTDVSSGQALRAEGCTVAAPAWDGDTVVAWELCSGVGWRLGRWSAAGALKTRSADVPDMSLPLHTAVADGQVLVSLDNHRIARVSASALADIPNGDKWAQSDW
jgi:hypothetical protein